MDIPSVAALAVMVADGVALWPNRMETDAFPLASVVTVATESNWVVSGGAISTLRSIRPRTNR
jgi:hypothetical protein